MVRAIAIVEPVVPRNRKINFHTAISTGKHTDNVFNAGTLFTSLNKPNYK